MCFHVADSKYRIKSGECSTAKALWDRLVVTYGSGIDSLQVFEFHKKVNTLRPGGDNLEDC